VNLTVPEVQDSREDADDLKDRQTPKETVLRVLRGFACHPRFAGHPRARWLLPLLVVLPALVPLLREGFFVSDDGLFHVYRIAALADAWEHGVLYPRLFPQFGFGYGQAVLNYYAPLSYAPGALLAVLGMSPAAAAEWTIALGFVLAAFAAYGMGKYLWGPTGGILAAIVYTYFPYHLADAYLRGALPEHMAFVFLPLIVWSTVEAFREVHPVAAYLWGSLAWAGLVYTHNLTVLLMAPAWIVLVLALALAGGQARGSGTSRAEQPRKWRRLGGATAGVALAAGLSAWVWLPFLAESRYVGIGLGPSDGYVGHLAPIGQLIQALPLYRYRISHGTGVAEHPLGWPAALLLVGIAGWLAWRWAARKPVAAPGPQAAGAAPAVYGLALAGAAALMTSAPSLPVWRLFEPVLAQLQYPWRFMTLVALGLAIAAGVVAADRVRGSGHEGASRMVHTDAPDIARGVPPGVETPGYNAMPAEAGFQPTSRPGDDAERQGPDAISRRSAGQTALVAVLAAVYIISGLARTPAEPLPLTPAEAWGTAAMWQEDAAAGQVGATWTGEFLPQAVTEQRWALGRALEGAQDGPVLSPPPRLRVEAAGYDRLTLAFESNGPHTVRLHQFHLPAWRVYIDGRRVETYPSGKMGLVTVDVPPETARASFRFGPTRAAMAAGFIVALSALVWALRGLSHRWQMRRRDRLGVTIAAPLLVALVTAIIANGAGLGVRTWTPAPVRSTVEDVAQLIGYDITPARGERGLDVTLYWFALRETGQNYKTFVHLLDAGRTVVSQHDGDPAGGYTPTTRWMQGELIADTHRLMLAEGLAGQFELAAGMYEVRPGESPGFRNLTVDPASPDQRIMLGSVTLP